MRSVLHMVPRTGPRLPTRPAARRRLARAAFCLFLSASPLGAQDLADPSVCTSEKGWIKVTTDFVNALASAGKSGRLAPQQFTDLSVWFQQMQTWLLETGDTKAFCEQFIATRKAHGF